ncbi:uncharacterized protein PADG_01569 [Paracoccidioides brasiliensis Pb18]|uniref:Flavin reductase like domain-containing protein n=2 Tax=Paracoccidioides brasiliensis TaxID=121759 RepID=C1G3Q3_PARBD|nr:uncharacterized protein PADG_01569 [Paracoccidioides brasiliensis Pb18]EEH45419.2 hypothetical protein PADG_01569 [Paracoccidioides brasiliensis Pb18]ODH43334.1 hypothetical protein ACO22_01054 [Paracoccidioides brasiliensis]ODH50219.1 hypothetical protein GX48_03641 [Paracoccidioides brasiliensis]
MSLTPILRVVADDSIKACQISPQDTTKPPPTVKNRMGYYASQTNVAKNAVVIDEDVDEVPQPTAEATARTENADSKVDIGNQVRLLMRRVPHPVAIITSTNPAAPTAQTSFRGMTVSSFNTVTLYPETIVSFNVKLPSETFNAICSSSRFLVHLLAPADATARLARDFSQGNTHVVLNDERDRFFKFVSISAGDDDRPPSIAEGEPPRLTLINAKGGPITSSSVDYFPFIFECRYLPQSVKVGNHVVVLGRVVNIIHKEADEHRDQVNVHSPERLCLSYADTRFWKIGENIDIIDS